MVGTSIQGPFVSSPPTQPLNSNQRRLPFIFKPEVNVFAKKLLWRCIGLERMEDAMPKLPPTCLARPTQSGATWLSPSVSVIASFYAPCTLKQRSVCVCLCEDTAPPTFSYGRFRYTGGFLGPGRPRTVRIRPGTFQPYHFRRDCVHGNSNLYESAPLSPAHFFLWSFRISPRICWTHLDQIRERKRQPYHHRRHRRGSFTSNLIRCKKKYVHIGRLNWRPQNFSTRW